jgi:hypothetical protein
MDGLDGVCVEQPEDEVLQAFIDVPAATHKQLTRINPKGYDSQGLEDTVRRTVFSRDQAARWKRQGRIRGRDRCRALRTKQGTKQGRKQGGIFGSATHRVYGMTNTPLKPNARGACSIPCPFSATTPGR